MIVIIFVVMAIWISALANACAPSSFGGGFFGPSAPIFLGGGGWNQGGWSPGGSGGSSLPGRSSGGTGSRGGGI